MVGINDWLDRSTDLLPALRDAGLRIGIGEQLKILRLLQLLEERNAAPQTPDELTRWLAPIICTRSDQVLRLKAALETQFAPVPVGRSQPHDTAPARDRRLSFASLGFGLSLSIIVALLAIALWRTPALLSQLMPDAKLFLPFSASPGNFSQRRAATIIIVAIVGAVTLGLLVYRRIHFALRHGQVVGQGQSQDVRLDPPADDSSNPALLRAARVLNRPSVTPTGRLDVAATVRATARSCGYFVPVWGLRRLAANWLLLVERSGSQDPLPAYGARLSALLARSGVRHGLYEFRRSPDWVRRGGPRGQHMPLERAIGAERPTRVLMLSEAARAIDVETSSRSRWLVDNDLPREIVLLTPKAREEWSSAEAQAAQAGILVLPANTNGLSTLARRIQAEELTSELIAPARETQFDTWQAERFIWLSRSKPAEHVVQNLIDNLSKLLSDDEFRLLVGIAAFPKVHLELVSTLDKSLRPNDEPAVQRTRLLKLGRLVWIKEGYVPEWLREALLRALPQRESRALRETWMRVLARAPQAGDPKTSLTIHLDQRNAGSGVAADGLFLSFLRGAFDLPAPVRWSRLAGLWRAPDRTDLAIAGAGGALIAFTLLFGADLLERLKPALLAWASYVATAQVIVLRFVTQEQCRFLTMLPLILALMRFVWGGVAGPVRASQVVAGIGAIWTIGFGWFGVDSALLARGTSAWFPALVAPIVIAGGVIVLSCLRQRPDQAIGVDLLSILQRSRGTGLSDTPTNLVMMFAMGLAAFFHDSRTSPFIFLIPSLGVVRAILISLCGAQLQASFPVARRLLASIAAGLVIGQLVAAAINIYFEPYAIQAIESNAKQTSFDTPIHSLFPFISIGLVLSGGLTGLLIALWCHRLVPMRACLQYSAIALASSGISYLAAAYFTQFFSGDPFLVSGGWTIPFIAAGLALLAVRQQKPADPAPFVLAALAIIGAGVAIMIPLFEFGSFSVLFGRFGSFWAFCSFAPLALIWPLIQRIFTGEPSLADEPPEWRARAPAPRLWIAAPLVLATALEIPLGRFRLDLPNLVVPLAIALSWRFGLRGWRTVLLMVLPAFWLDPPKWVAPIMAPFGLYGPDWVAPITIDVALSTLLVAALFARPLMLSQIYAVSSLPWITVSAIVVMLSLQIHYEQSAWAFSWAADSLLVLSLFLLALSSLQTQRFIIVALVALVLLAPVLVLAFAPSNASPIHLLAPQTGVAGLAAYLLGRLLRGRLVGAATHRGVSWAADSALTATLMLSVFPAMWASGLSFNPTGGGPTAFVTLACLLAFCAGVACGDHRPLGLYGALGLSGLIGSGIFSLWVGSQIPWIVPLGRFAEYQSPFRSLILPFLPVAFFLIGRPCRDTLSVDAAMLAAPEPSPEPTWLATRDAILAGARAVVFRLRVIVSRLQEWWGAGPSTPPLQARSPGEMHTGAIDANGEQVSFVYFQNKDYAIYRSASRVRIAFSANKTVADEQKSAVGDLLSVRDDVSPLIAGLPRNIAHRYEWEIARFFRDALEGGREFANSQLQIVVSDIKQSATRHRRRISVWSAVFVFLIAGLAGSTLILYPEISFLYPGSKNPLFSVMLVSGAIGALVSRLFALLAQSSEAEVLRLTWASIPLTALQGAFFATVLFIAVDSKIVSFRIGELNLDSSGLNWQTAVLAGFMAGFSERLILARFQRWQKA
jgi:hypothetical protein